MTSICFTAIVKNEAKVIERCIDSCLPYISSYCVVDTGSTDGTQDVVKNYFAQHNIPGEVVQSDWKGFGDSRTEAVRATGERADYLLMMDADHTLHVEQWPKSLDKDAYRVYHHYNGSIYPLPILLSTKVKWKYKMPVHEYLEGDRQTSVEDLKGAIIRVHTDGARSQNPEKYAGDIEILERYCAENPDDPRPQYYLAQSMRDAGRPMDAYHAYAKRAQMGGWEEEAWHALYMMGCVLGRTEAPLDVVVSTYLQAYDRRPVRAEPLVAAAIGLRKVNRFSSSYMMAKQALEIPYPATDILFVEQRAYTWCPWDEIAVSAWYTGRMEEGRAAAEKALTFSDLPPLERERIERNLRMYRERNAQGVVNG